MKLVEKHSSCTVESLGSAPDVSLGLVGGPRRVDGDLSRRHGLFVRVFPVGLCGRVSSRRLGLGGGQKRALGWGRRLRGLLVFHRGRVLLGL